MNYRNPDLLALARLAPHCMCCGAPNVGQVIAAHSNQSHDGKGMGIKAHDFRCAFVCDICHVAIDIGHAPRGDRWLMWEEGHRATIAWLFQSGHLIVAPEAVRPDPPPKPKARIRKGRKLQGRSEFPAGRKLTGRNALSKQKEPR